MIIKLVLFLLFFLWVVEAPYPYRNATREQVLNSAPEVILNQEDKKVVADLVNACKICKVGNPKRTKVLSDLAQIRWQQLNFKDAETLYRAALDEQRKQTDFDSYLTDLMLGLAAVLTEQQKLDEAADYYSKILNYDTKYLSKNDTRIARDYNNLGLNTYLKSLSKDRGQERTNLLDQANNFYKQALQIYRSQPKTDQAIAVVLYNQHLALRDLNDLKGAKLARAQADSIDSRLGRVVKAP